MRLPTLRATPNTTAAGIRFAAEMGAIPNPSLAIHRGDHPFATMGEISLVAAPQLVDPGDPAVHIYDADCYSGRTPERRFHQTAETHVLAESVRSESRRLGGSETDAESIESGRDPEWTATSLAADPAGIAIYLGEVHGVRAEPVLRAPIYQSPAFGTPELARYFDALDVPSGRKSLDLERVGKVLILGTGSRKNTSRGKARVVLRKYPHTAQLASLTTAGSPVTGG